MYWLGWTWTGIRTFVRYLAGRELVVHAAYFRTRRLYLVMEGDSFLGRVTCNGLVLVSAHTVKSDATRPGRHVCEVKEGGTERGRYPSVGGMQC